MTGLNADPVIAVITARFRPERTLPAVTLWRGLNHGQYGAGPFPLLRGKIPGKALVLQKAALIIIDLLPRPAIVQLLQNGQPALKSTGFPREPADLFCPINDFLPKPPPHSPGNVL